MPIYEYKCQNGHVFDVMQRMSDDSLTTCQVCEAPVQRVFHPVAVHFKGSGFYNTDYGTRRRAKESADGKGESSGTQSSSEKSSTEKGSSEKKKAESSTTSSSSSSSSSD